MLKPLNFLFVFVFVFVLFDFSVSIRSQNLKKTQQTDLKSKVKYVHYALKQNNKFKVVKVAAKNLQIEPWEEWTAKALFIGNDYNSTG
jgi:hypothetical protein